MLGKRHGYSDEREEGGMMKMTERREAEAVPRKRARVSFNSNIMYRTVIVHSEEEDFHVTEQAPATRDEGLFQDAFMPMKTHDGSSAECEIAWKLFNAVRTDRSMTTFHQMVELIAMQGMADLLLKVKAVIMELIIRIARKGSAGFAKSASVFKKSSLPVLLEITKALHASAMKIRCRSGHTVCHASAAAPVALMTCT